MCRHVASWLDWGGNLSTGQALTNLKTDQKGRSPRPMAEPPLPLDLDAHDTALFLDCDGTLSEIVDHPDDARIEPQLRDTVGRLSRQTGGAVAIVSGRSIAQLDALLAPLELPAAGVHGAERRDHAGKMHAEAAVDCLDPARMAAARDFAVRHAGLVSEVKPGAVALHYRMRPELEAKVESFAAALVAGQPRLSLRYGKKVVEIAAGHRTKGDAIAAFMREPPFAGRLPVFVGDDITDEDGFAVVASMGGRTIRIGEGPTCAALRAADRGEVERWLVALAKRWSN